MALLFQQQHAFGANSAWMLRGGCDRDPYVEHARKSQVSRVQMSRVNDVRGMV